jgi:hypothetical protein
MYRLEFCLREDLNKTAPRVMVVLDPKVSNLITLKLKKNR